MEQNYSRTLRKREAPNISLPQIAKIPGGAVGNGQALQRRRKVLGGLLASEGFEWNDIYPES
ncbi:MAG: hypothetical protein KY428_12800 [Bacteroidetes bacterium]|nr:hypothetical protein [Bacteroidota bacterium]